MRTMHSKSPVVNLAEWREILLENKWVSVRNSQLLLIFKKDVPINLLTSGKMLLSEHKKANMFKAKTLIEKVDTRYLKEVPWSPQQTIPDHRLYLSIQL